MEPRSSNKKLSDTSAIKKPQSNLLRLKTPGRNLRSSINRRVSSRVIPPLTPLHRLKRFKAIRDKNLSKGRPVLAQKKFFSKMEEITTTAVVHEAKAIKQEDSEVHVLRADVLENDGSRIQEKVKNGTEIINGTNFEDIVNGKDDENLSEDENAYNGHGIENEKSTPNSPDEEGNDKIIGDRNSSNVHSCKEMATTDNYVENKPELAEENYDDAQENLPNELEEPCDKVVHGDLIKDGSVESDAGSVSSSSTFPNQFLTSSSEDVSEAAGKKEENSEEEIDVEQVSSKSDDREKETESQEHIKLTNEAPFNEKKPIDIPSKIPRSVLGSGSSYKTAYGSTGRISGRRAVGGIYRTSNLKRKAEEEIEPFSSGKRLSSPSQPSPRWKFFRPSISDLWSPRKTLYDFSVSSTPVKNVDDSMAVNIDEKSINHHLNDSDLFLDSNESPLMNKRSRWGCSVM